MLFPSLLQPCSQHMAALGYICRRWIDGRTDFLKYLGLKYLLLRETINRSRASKTFVAGTCTFNEKKNRSYLCVESSFYLYTAEFFSSSTNQLDLKGKKKWRICVAGKPWTSKSDHCFSVTVFFFFFFLVFSSLSTVELI